MVQGFAALPRTGRQESALDFPAKPEAQPESTAIFRLRKQLENVEKRGVVQGRTVYGAKEVKLDFLFASLAP
jgi:hypothetical protein